MTRATKPNGYAIYKLIEKEAAGQYQINDPRVQQTIRGAPAGEPRATAAECV